MPVDGHPQDDARDAVLRQVARSTLSEDITPKKIAVAVSGGGDSMALLHLYAQLARTDAFQIMAVTVDHGLRPAAADEAALVARFCAAENIPHQILTWDGANSVGNLMAAARAARYRLIADWATAQRIDLVLLGHTKDDIAENFLIRLARKSGPDGLAAMEVAFARDGIQWARPLWQQARAELRDYLRRHRVAWVDDPTNDDEAFERVRMRRALVTLDPLGITTDVLASVSGSMRAARDALHHYARIESRRYIMQDQGDLVLRLALTGPLPDEIKRRLWRSTLPWINGADYPPRNAALFDAVNGLVKDGHATVGGCLITRRGDNWRVTREYQAVRDETCQTTEVWDGRWVLDGPHSAELTVRALGEGIRDCPDWRDTGFPRTSLVATPAIWHGPLLIAAPVAGLASGWTAQIVADFHQHAFAH